jgi:hypothetical protein
MAKKVIQRPAPHVIEPRHPSMPRYYEWDSESEPGRKHRVTVFRGEVKGCTCRGAKHGCWHQSEALRYESMITHEETEMPEENDRAVAVREPQLPSREVVVQLHNVGAMLPTTQQYDMMWAMAQTAKNAGAGMLPDNIKTPEAALAVMLAGWEFGFQPFTALRQVFIVNGKTQLMSEGLYALMKQRDRSLEVVWHERSATGAEASLWRGGREIIRIRYDESDKERAHQGQRRGGGNASRKWIPVYEADGKTQKKYAQGHQRAGEGMVKINPEYDESAPVAWEDDPSSPWTGYPTDMYSWAVLKRLERFGAPELVNLAPMMVAADEDEPMVVEPRAPLSAAIAAGQVSAAAASEATEPPSLEGNPDVPPEEPAQEPEPEAAEWEDITPDDEEETPPEEGSTPPDPAVPVWQSWLPAQVAEQKAKLHARLVKAKAAMTKEDYGNMARGIARDLCGDEKNLDLDALGAEQVYEAINRTVVAEGGDIGMYWGD